VTGEADDIHGLAMKEQSTKANEFNAPVSCAVGRIKPLQRQSGIPWIEHGLALNGSAGWA